MYGTYYSRTVVTPRLGMAPVRERVQRALGIWDVLFTHCCDSKARQHSPSLQCRPKGLPKATKKFEYKYRFHRAFCSVATVARPSVSAVCY